LYYRTKSEVDLQSTQSAHSLELTNAKQTAMDTIEQIRQKYEGQLSAVREELLELKSLTASSTASYDKRIMGK
jgi:hypothetical protein